MKRTKIKFNKLKLLGLLGVSCFSYLTFISPHEPIEAAKSVATHIGTFEGSTTFTTSSSNGINPGLFIEVMDDEGNLTQYESEEGTITIPDTKEGAYVTQAKLLGKTKYVDEDTGEVLDDWEEGRNLRLESSENPGLMTVGKNLFNSLNLEQGTSANVYQLTWEEAKNSNVNNHKDTTRMRSINIFPIKPNTTYTLSNTGNLQYAVKQFNVNGVGLQDDAWLRTPYTFTTRQNTSYLALQFKVDDVTSIDSSQAQRFNIQLEEGVTTTSYNPHQSNTITVNEELTLRSVGDVRDELDLITGEVTERIGEIVLDGVNNKFLGKNNNSEYGDGRPRFDIRVEDIYVQRADHWGDTSKVLMCDKLKTGFFPNFANNKTGNVIAIWVNILTVIFEDASITTLEQANEYLQQNLITVQYQLETKSIKTVTLNSDYFFQPINSESIQVTGTVTPLVGSVTVPTTPVSFVLNPNEEAGQQFIAPEFSISNDTTAPIRLTLNRFEQTTNVLNDVLPDKYHSWEGLNKQESKNIALALVPKPSDGWVSLNEEPRYVADSSRDDLGIVKAKSRVDFTFSALHGQAFEEVLSPSYRLGFVFEFTN